MGHADNNKATRQKGRLIGSRRTKHKLIKFNYILSPAAYIFDKIVNRLAPPTQASRSPALYINRDMSACLYIDVDLYAHVFTNVLLKTLLVYLQCGQKKKKRTKYFFGFVYTTHVARPPLRCPSLPCPLPLLNSQPIHIFPLFLCFPRRNRVALASKKNSSNEAFTYAFQLVIVDPINTINNQRTSSPICGTMRN